MDLTTLAAVKQYIGPGLQGTQSDALLSGLITAYSQFIERYCGRRFASQQYTERRNGNGGCEMVLTNFPVTAVASLTVYGSAIGYPLGGGGTLIPAAADPTQPGWALVDSVQGDQRILLLQGGYEYCRGRANVVIVYTAGYANTAAVPTDLAEACNELVTLRYRSRDWEGYLSKQLAPQEIVRFDTKGIPERISMLLDPYQELMVPG